MFRATLKIAKGETLTLAQDVLAAWDTAGLAGSLAGGAFSNAALEVRAQRNAAADKAAADYAAATNALARYKGYYTVALPPEAELEAPGAVGNVPLGSGWLALTVKDGGAVALAGKLADGTALSGASTLLVLADGVAGEAAYVPFLFPLYSAKGVFSGVLEILQSASAPTGLFSGTFNLYYEYRDQKGALQLKTVPVTHAGALTPTRGDPDSEPAGQGSTSCPTRGRVRTPSPWPTRSSGRTGQRSEDGDRKSASDAKREWVRVGVVVCPAGFQTVDGLGWIASLVGAHDDAKCLPIMPLTQPATTSCCGQILDRGVGGGRYRPLCQPATMETINLH